MRRPMVLVAVIAMLMTACSSDTTPSTTSEEATTSTTASTETTVAETPDSTGVPTEEDLIDWDPELAEELAALETANDGQWTIETALAAVPLVRRGLEAGVNTWESPVDLTRLAVFLSDHIEEIPQDQWQALFASTQPTTQLIAFQTDQTTRQVYQEIAEEANRRLEGLLDHRLVVPIYVALSDYTKPANVSAATPQNGARPDGYRFLFRDEDVFRQAADDISGIAAFNEVVCVIVLGQGMLGWDETSQIAAIVHELVHCHQHVTYPDGIDAFFASSTLWMDEGYAAWAGEAYVGGTEISKPWWDRYFLDRNMGRNRDSFQLFTGSYYSFSFFWMLQRAGIDPWSNFTRWFRELRRSGVSDVDRFLRMSAGANTDVVAGWTASATRNSDFGTPWDSENSPGVGASSNSRIPTPQRVLGESTMRAEPGEQRYRLAQVVTPTDAVSVITVAANGMGIYRWQYSGWEEQFLVNGSYEQSWCVGEDCVCEDGTSPVPDMAVAPITAGQHPELHVAMFGASRGAEAVVSVTTLEDECEEEEPPSGPLDACLFGTWNPDPDQFRDLILTFYASIPGVSGLTLDGTIDLTFNDDGTFTHVYNGVAGSGTYAGQTIDATWSGGTFGNWEAAGGVITLTFTGTNISVKVGPTIGRAPSIPTESVDAPYTCGPTSVRFDPPDPGYFWPLPEDWTKVS